MIHLDTNQKKADIQIAQGKGENDAKQVDRWICACVFFLCGVTSCVGVQEQELRT